MSLFAKAAAFLGMTKAVEVKPDPYFLPVMNVKMPSLGLNEPAFDRGPANQAMPVPPSYFRPPSQRQKRKAARRLNRR